MEKSFMGCMMREGSGGKDVKKVVRYVERFDLIGGWYMGVNKKGANYIIYSPDDQFGFVILLFGMGTGEAEVDVMFCKIIMKG